MVVVKSRGRVRIVVHKETVDLWVTGAENFDGQLAQSSESASIMKPHRICLCHNRFVHTLEEVDMVLLFTPSKPVVSLQNWRCVIVALVVDELHQAIHRRPLLKLR